MLERILDVIFGIKIDVITIEEACNEIASRRVTVSLTFKPVVVELSSTGPEQTD